MNIVARPNAGNQIKVTSAGIRSSNIHVAPSGGEKNGNVYHVGGSTRTRSNASSRSQTQTQSSFTNESRDSMIHSDEDVDMQDFGNEDDDMLRELELLSNPSKLNSATDVGDEHSDHATSIDTSDHMRHEDHDDMLDDNNGHDVEDVDHGPQQSGTNKSSAREKYKYLNKLRRLAKKGVHVKSMSTANTLHELQEEWERAFHMSNADSSIKVGRRVLMAFVTGIEFANERFKPFKISLNGWSEHVYENIEEYDDALDQLTDSYTSSMELSPEWTIILGLIGSAFMFHLSNTMFKTMMPSGVSSSKEPNKIDAGLDADALKQALRSNSNPQEKTQSNLPMSVSSNLFKLPTNDTFPELPKSARGISSRIDELDDDTKSQVSDALDSVRTESSRKKKKSVSPGNSISISLT